jgi:hypothetical protein
MTPERNNALSGSASSRALEIIGASLIALALTANRIGLGHNPGLGWKKILLLLIGLPLFVTGTAYRRQAGVKLLSAVLVYSGVVMIGVAIAAHRLQLGHNPELRWTKALLFIGGLGFTAVGVRVFYASDGILRIYQFAFAYFGIVSAGVALAVYPLGLAQDPAFRAKRVSLLVFGLVMSGMAALSKKLRVQEWLPTCLYKSSSALEVPVRTAVRQYAREFADHPQIKLDRTRLIIAASAYMVIVAFMWGTFALSSGMPYETGFPYMSETSSVLHGFIYPGDPLRPNTNTFYHLSYLLGELFAPGSFVPYQVVYALLWFARGLLVFIILRRLLPNSVGISYVAGALTLVHSADSTLQWIGQMNQVGFIFWLMLGFYLFVLAYDSGRLRILLLLILVAAGSEYMCLWSYESGIFIILLIPVAVFLVRRPVRKLTAILCCAWYLVPILYVMDTALKYLHSAGQTYQESVLRTDWAPRSIASDLGFNVLASLSFWNWGKRFPVTMPQFQMALLAVSATAAFICGAVLITYNLRGGKHQPAGLRRVGVGLILAGLLWVVASFPAYLLLNSARMLWRTQLLSGPGAAMAFTGAIALTVSYIRPRSIRHATALFLSAIIAYYGAAGAIQRGSFHRQIWESHRKAIAALLRAVPQVSPNTIIAMVGVPSQGDPFRHDMWFDLALRLAYPRTSVAGVYFLDGGDPAQGNELSMTDGQWHSDDKFYEPLRKNGGLSQTIVIHYSPDGVDQVLDRIPGFLCHNLCRADKYQPYARIVSSVPSPRAVRRYGPIWGQ